MSGKMKMLSSSGPGPYQAQFQSVQSHSIHSYSCPIDLGFQDDLFFNDYLHYVHSTQTPQNTELTELSLTSK